MNGYFISMEGADGAGKSLQAKLLSDYFSKYGIRTVITREPGGTAIGELIRNILIDKNNSEMETLTEIFLYAAARAQIVNELIKPSLDSGALVICDRFTDSSIAYQCYARGLDYKMVSQLNEYACSGISPDITFFLDLPPEIGITRKLKDTSPDRLELEGLDFQKKVYDGYKKIAEHNPRVVTIDASGQPEQIRDQILKKLETVENYPFNTNEYFNK